MPVCAPGPLRCRETLYWADNSVALAAGVHRVNRVVVRSFCRQVVYAHAENSVVMGWVQPDVRLGSQVQFLGIRAVVHHGKVLGRAAWIVACPANDGQMLVVQFDFGSLPYFQVVRPF